MAEKDSLARSGSWRRAQDHDVLGLLRAALDGDGFGISAQPVVDLATGATVEHELMLRLPAHDGHSISPERFLPVAERFGLAAELADLLIRRAAGLAAGGDGVALDVLAGSIADPGLAGRTEQILADAGAPPGLMTFELSERTLTTNASAAAAFVTACTIWDAGSPATPSVWAPPASVTSSACRSIA